MWVRSHVFKFEIFDAEMGVCKLHASMKTKVLVFMGKKSQEVVGGGRFLLDRESDLTGKLEASERCCIKIQGPQIILNSIFIGNIRRKINLSSYI